MPRLPRRPVLMLDALACLAMGVGLTALAAPLETLTALPSGLSRGAGMLLLPVAAFILLVASRPAIPAAGVATIVAGNAAWVAASLVAAVLVEANAIGLALILGQAGAVALIAWLEASARPERAVGATT